MAKAKKLSSGAWRVQVYAGKGPNGKAKYISITRETEKEADFAALEYQLSRKKHNRNSVENKTLREAIDIYIENRDAILSPSTIREYRQTQRNALQGLMDIPLRKITQEMIQREINIEARTKAPKTVRNIHGLLSGVFREYLPNFQLTTKLPQKKKTTLYIPDIDTVNKIIQCATGTRMEVPILLAVCLGLRRSEILGLQWKNVDFKANTILINEAIVIGEDGNPVSKAPKSYAGTRKLQIPEILLRALKEKKETAESKYIVEMTGSTIYKAFRVLLSENDLPEMRFHDLRHVTASIMLALNVPNKYAAERMGHASENMLKNVYQHTLKSEEEKINQVINNFFSNNIKIEE